MSDLTSPLLRGLSRLAFDAFDSVTGIVETMHADIAKDRRRRNTTGARRADGITGAVYRTVRGVGRGMARGVDLALTPLEKFAAPGVPTLREETAVCVLNGVSGDHLEATGNPLAIKMQFRHEGRALSVQREALASQFPTATGKIVVLVHGLCMSDRHWQREDSSHADSFAALGHTAVHLRYNSGRHISANGRQFSDLLQQLVEHWPIPVQDISFVCHSMGGLVARSACHYGARASWRTRLRKIIFLGTPHHGAPLERAGNFLEAGLGVLPYASALARLGKSRSAGITDLRHGNVLDEDWQGVDRFQHRHDRRQPLALPEGVACYAVAALKGEPGQSLKSALLGDGLVRVDSALGKHCDPTRDLGIAQDRRWVGHGMGHFDLLHNAQVRERVDTWLQET